METFLDWEGGKEPCSLLAIIADPFKVEIIADIKYINTGCHWVSATIYLLQR